jgi:hypothetical protein
MAKPKAKGRGAKPSKQSSKHDAKDELYSDELDDFQKQRDKISLDASDDPMSADELDDEAVYDLSDDNDDDSDDDDVDDDEDALDDAIERGGDMAARKFPICAVAFVSSKEHGLGAACTAAMLRAGEASLAWLP